MKLGTFSVSLPIYEIKSDVTHQTIRMPTVIERMIMRLCGRYRDKPEISEWTLSRIFEQQLGMASANDLVAPSVEELIYLRVLGNPVSRDYMDIRLIDLSLSAEGFDFLERDRLPSRPKKDSVTHLFCPLPNVVKQQGVDNRFSTMPERPFVSDGVFYPSDCSQWVREAIVKETYPWKLPSTEIHSVKSNVARIMWEKQKIAVDCDESGVLTLKAIADANFDQWLKMANPDMVWQHILEPVLVIMPASEFSVGSILPELSADVLRNASEVALVDGVRAGRMPSMSSQNILRVVRDDANLERYVDENLVVLKKVRSVSRLQSRPGTLWIEAPIPVDLPSGFEELVVHKAITTPSINLAGFVKLFWASQAHRVALSIVGDENIAIRTWNSLQFVLESTLVNTQDAALFALRVIWESPQEIFLQWQDRVMNLSINDLVDDASLFISAIKMFSRQPEENWNQDWQSALSGRLFCSVSSLDGEIAIEAMLILLADIGRLLSVKSVELHCGLLSHCSSISEMKSLAALRKVIGETVALPDHVVGDSLLQQWISEVLSNEETSFFGPHPFVKPLDSLRSAHQAMLRDIGLKSLEDAVIGNLSLHDVKTSALASVAQWQAAFETVRQMRQSLSGDSIDKLIQFNLKVVAWRDLATQKLAHPAPSGQRLVVLDTSALMNAPEILTSMRSGDAPVVPRRVLEELDGLKESTDEGQARKARSASRALEDAEQEIRYESEVLGLLPPDWAPSSDNRILSVALYLRLSNVVLVTGDRNLRNKAHAENISAMLPEEYKGISPISHNGKNKKKGAK